MSDRPWSWNGPLEPTNGQLAEYVRERARNGRNGSTDGARLDPDIAYRIAARLAAAGNDDAVRAQERDRVINYPEVRDFLLGVILEAQHQQVRWQETDPHKADFDWHAVATYLGAKALLNPPQNDGTTGKDARLHRIVALAALCANWHAAVLARDEPIEFKPKTMEATVGVSPGLAEALADFEARRKEHDRADLDRVVDELDDEFES